MMWLSEGGGIKNVCGFSMLELLLVMSIMGLISSFVIPDMWGSYEKIQERSVVAELGSKLNGIKLESKKEKIFQKVDFADSEISSSLPAEWQVIKGDTMFCYETGVVKGGTVELLSSSGRTWLLKIADVSGDAHIFIVR